MPYFTDVLDVLLAIGDWPYVAVFLLRTLAPVLQFDIGPNVANRREAYGQHRFYKRFLHKVHVRSYIMGIPQNPIDIFCQSPDIMTHQFSSWVGRPLHRFRTIGCSILDIYQRQTAYLKSWFGLPVLSTPVMLFTTGLLAVFRNIVEIKVCEMIKPQRKSFCWIFKQWIILAGTSSMLAMTKSMVLLKKVVVFCFTPKTTVFSFPRLPVMIKYYLAVISFLINQNPISRITHN